MRSRPKHTCEREVFHHAQGSTDNTARAFIFRSPVIVFSLRLLPLVRIGKRNIFFFLLVILLLRFPRELGWNNAWGVNMNF